MQSISIKNYSYSFVNAYNTGKVNGELRNAKCLGYIHDIENYIDFIDLEYANKVVYFNPKNFIFVTNCDETLDTINARVLNELPTLAPIDGQYFLGWWDNPEFSGDNIVTPFYTAEDEITLYAKWSIVPFDGELSGLYGNSEIMTFGGHTYALFDGSDRSINRIRRCEELNGHLVSIDSETENEFVAGLAGKYDKCISIGVKRVNGKLVQLNGDDLVYENWSEGEPSGNGQSAVMYQNGKWDDRDYESEPFLCEWDFIWDSVTE